MYALKHQVLHSYNPYIHKCCGCVHLRIGSIIACLIWAGFSLYFAILSFQGKSPFFSHIENAAMYIFGIINLVYFGISLGSIVPIYFTQLYPIRTSVFVISLALACLLTDLVVNIIIFIVKRPAYVQWCINSNSDQLNDILVNNQITTSTNTTLGFSTEMDDFYNCNRAWEDELKFSILSAVLISTVYVYWAIIIYSYCVKLKYQLMIKLQSNLQSVPMMGNILPN